MMQKQAMDMDMDQVVEIPDTPDRLTTRHGDRKDVGKPNVDIMSMTNSGRDFADADEVNYGNNYVTVSSSEKSLPSQNAPMFRRAQTQKNFGPGTTRSNAPKKMDKGKIVSSNSPSKSSRHGSVSVLHLSEENGGSKQMQSTFSNHGSRNIATEHKKELKSNFGNSSLPFTDDSSNASRNVFRGNCNKTLSGSNRYVDRGKSIALSSDSQCTQKIEKQVSLHPPLSFSPRVTGQKRLVRNGCISPHNIATRAKQSTEKNSHQSIDIEQNRSGHSVSSNTTPPISVDDIIAEVRGNGRVKGKGVLIHPSSHGVNAGTVHTAISRPVINNEEVGGTTDATRNSIKYSAGQSGWRTMHNDVGRSISGKNRNIMDRRDTGGGQSGNGVTASLLDHAAQATLLTIPEANQLAGIHSTTDALTKRQRKHGSASGSRNGSSYNSEIMFLGSSGESSRSPRSPVSSSEVIELLSEPRFTNRISIDLDDNDDVSSDARAQQVEADEILARELQEQLYRDDSFEGGGIDQQIAWEEFEDLLHTAIDSHNIPHPIRMPREPSNRQPRPSTRQNPSNRRAMPHVSLSNRTSQLRSRTIRRSLTPRISTRGSRSMFPMDMDLDMRLDILEALEDAVGGLSDMGMADDVFHVGRDFNEDDYEMLLALDEGNHHHTGASAIQINGLPQSTIQSDNCTEVCAVCIETPVKGETIRHLPCLHKFHKDCIDPWLRRKPSCPVCKSSIT